MKKQTIIIGIVAVAVIFGVYCFVAKNKKISTVETPTVIDTSPVSVPVEQSGKIDEHLTINNELRDVNFCGKTYKVKQILIDGVDVVQRVAELAGENKKVSTFPKYKGTDEICEAIISNYAETAELKVGGHKAFPNNAGKEIDYTLGIDNPRVVGILFQFDISTSKNTIYQLGETYGDFVERIPIGTIKK